MIDTKLNVDEVWKGLGPWGRYQRFQIFLIFMDGMAAAFHLLSTVVIGYRYPYQCTEVDTNCTTTDAYCGNSSIYIDYGKCEMDIYRNGTNRTLIKSQDCVDGYTYPVSKDRTFVTEWDLVCHNASYAELTQTLVIIGQATGAAIFTQFSDRFGRKPIHILGHVGVFVVALIMAFVPNYPMFAVLRYLIGTFQQGIVTTNVVMALELSPRELRFKVFVFDSLAWTTGVALLAPLGYLFRNISWRYLQMTLALYSVYSLGLYWLMEESVRWLIANGKSKEAERIIRKAAKLNKVDYDEVIKRANKHLTTDGETNSIAMVSGHASERVVDTDLTENDIVPSFVETTDSEQSSKGQENNNTGEVKRYTILTILKTRKVLINSFILWYIWIVDSLTYYGIALLSYTLSGNRFLNFFLQAIMEYPATITIYFLANRIGRKKTVIFFHAVTGIACLTATVFVTLANGNSSMLAASTAFTLIGKYGSAGSFASIFLYTPELYPTNLRNVGLGVASSISRIGGMLAPFSGPLAEKIKWAPGTIFGSMCMLVTVLCIRLPETTTFSLPQTLEEMDKWSKNKNMNKKPLDYNRE